MVTVIRLKEHRGRNGILINLFSLVLNTVTEQSWKYLGLGSYIKSTLKKMPTIIFLSNTLFNTFLRQPQHGKKQQQDFIKPICKMLVLHDDLVGLESNALEAWAKENNFQQLK